MLEFPEVNRRAFLLELGKVLERAQEKARTVGLVIVDITNLARINRMHGHGAGDMALAIARERLDGTSTETNNVFRVASHHFVFILPALKSSALIALAANRLRTVLREPIAVGEHEVRLDVVVGVSTSVGGQDEPETLLEIAEHSLDKSKSDPGYGLLERDEDSVEHAKNRIQLEQDFMATLNANGFELHYQPKIDLTDGRVTSCEALLRWPRPDGGYLSPGVAVEIAESLNQGYTLSKWILGEAIRQARSWRERFNLRIAVNVEATLIDSPDLYNLVADTLSIWGTEHTLVNLEVTETAVLSDRASSFDNLRKLKEFGIGLSIDDFGTGYSSLSYFRSVPAEEIKIDQTFIHTMDSDPLNRELVRIIIEIAHLFGMRAVAEGVEDAAILDILREVGCDGVQGFHFARPLPPADFEAWLDAWSGFPA